MSRLAAVSAALLLVAACDDKTPASPAAVTVVQLSAGDANCPYGGASFTSGGTTAYACTGASGSQGVQGVQGIQGIPGLSAPYQTRADVYCDSVTAGADTNAVLMASCRATGDLPLSGSCDQYDRDDVVVSTAMPSGWHATGTPGAAASFWCSWSKSGLAVPLNTVPHARAHICCIAVP
jgi:hypothetical protein